MGVASLVLGIIALVLDFALGAFGAAWVGLLLGVVGIILGALGRKNPEKRGIATAGLVCSIIAVVLGGIVLLACAACAGATASMFS